MTVRGLLAVAAVMALGASLVFAYFRLEGSEPTLTAPDAISVGKQGSQLVVEVGDADSGLRSVELRVLYPGGGKTLLERPFRGELLTGGPTRNERIELDLEPELLGLPDGSASLIVTARDWSWRDGLAGNRAEQSIDLIVDTRPPEIEIPSGITYLKRGGAAALVYSTNEPTERDGVRVGEHFFPGYPLAGCEGSDSQRVALFAAPVDGAQGAETVVVAVDVAGNAAEESVRARILERRFRDVRVPLSRGFLDTVSKSLATANEMQSGDAVADFRRVNEELRGTNEARIRELVAAAREASCRRRFEGAFTQLRNSAVTGHFAEQRDYRVGGAPVSRATHYGFDLASTANAPVTAANSGVVIFAGELGIYGNMVLIDHGLGLTSLYGHLSSIDVAVGDEVAKGEVLGNSGATGLAGGDHLHFALLVGDTYVDALEWWDPKWVRTHIDARIAPQPQ